MSLKLMYITNNPNIAQIAEASGVDWIFVDLEVNGKEARQANLDTVKSKHSISDISKIKEALNTSELLVRINPIFHQSEIEIEKVIAAGADIIMLPYFISVEEIKIFLSIVDNRVKTMLLLETPEAVEVLDDILELEGIDYIHIGLNDLHLGYQMNFMFELLADGTVEELGEKILNHGIPFGFGGIANIGEGMLPAENIITEHYRLNSSMVILSRSFCNVDKITDFNMIKSTFFEGVSAIRDYEEELTFKNKRFYNNNRLNSVKIINEISDKNY